MGMQDFDYGTFKMAYDSDPTIQAMVHRFDANGIELKTKKTVDNPEVKKQQGGDTLKTSAMAATKRNLG